MTYHAYALRAPPLDEAVISELRASMADDGLTLAAIVDEFIYGASEHVTELEGAVEASDLPAAVRAVHGLRGMSGIVGAVVVAEQAASIEAKMQQDGIEVGRIGADMLRAEVDRAIEALRTQFAAGS